MNFKVIHSRKRTSHEIDYYLKDSDNYNWTFRVIVSGDGTRRGGEFTEYPKHWKSLLISTSLANVTRKSHLYDLVYKAIENWDIKKDLTPETFKTFNELIDEL